MRTFKTFLFASLMIVGFQINAQDETTDANDATGQTSDSKDNDKRPSATAAFGAVTMDGKNYTRIRFLGDIPIGEKFGFGLDIDLLMDENQNIRKEDWDDWQDYLDKIYYIRYGRKGDPFYIKLGGLRFSYLGFRGIFNGYTNMLQYPSNKKYGMETDFTIGDVRTEILVSDFKEAIDKGTTVIGARVSKPFLGDLTVGVSTGIDLNEYNGLIDKDGDGYSSVYDYDDNKSSIHNYRQKVESDLNTQVAAGKITAADKASYLNTAEIIGQIKSAGDYNNIPKYRDSTSRVYEFGVDLSYPIFKGDWGKLTVYTQGMKIIDYGMGASIPGLQLNLGSFFYANAEYRLQTKEFIFGYFNNTYDNERVNAYSLVTRSQMLKGIVDPMQGFMASAGGNIMGIIELSAGYQDMFNSTQHIRSLQGDLGVARGAITNLEEAKLYYMQNNVQDFREWKSPSTIMGARIAYNQSGMILALDYKWTFRDMDGDGLIRNSNETIKTFSVSAGVKF